MPRIVDKPVVTATEDDFVTIVHSGTVALARIGDLPTIQGDPGPAGADGPPGPAGSASQLLSGSVNPTGAVGNDGDWYLNTSTGTLYKKTSGSWSVLMSLVGPTGPDGPQGPAGGSAGNFVPSGTGAVTRSANVKFAEIQLSMADYGFATGNSAAANKTAWDNAVAAAVAAKADLWIPPGTYSITNVDHNKQVNIFGVGRNRVQLNITTTTTHGFVIRQDAAYGAGTTICMRGFTIHYSGSGIPLGYAGLFIQAKVDLDSIDVEYFNRVGIEFAPNNANVASGLKGSIGNAPFFSTLRNVRARYNGSHGCWLRMGANVTQFEYCSFSNNDGHGFYHFNDSPDDNGATASTYGTIIIGGQASYNTGSGYYFESGTNITSWGTYAEYNGSPTNTNSDGYTATPYDYYFGNNIVRTFFVIGVLLNADSGKVRLPPSSNTTCYVFEGGRALSSIIPKKAGTVASFTGTTVTDLRNQLNTAFATLRAANICG